MKALRHRIEFVGVRLVLWMAGALPLSVTRRVGAAIGWFAWNALRVRHAVAMDNIQRALGVNAREAERIGSASYSNLGRSLMEFTALRRLSSEDVRQLVTYRGSEHLDAARAGGRGAVLFGGHLGCWEILGDGFAAHGYPIDFLVGEQTNRSVDEIMNALRQRHGAGIIHRGFALRPVLRSLRDNRLLMILGDHDARKGGIFVEFFGRPASAVKGPALFAIKQNCPVLNISIRRERDGRHTARVEAPLWPDPSLEGDEAVRDLTQRCTRQLEDDIRRRPEEYFWGHRRWKTQPVAESESVTI